MDANTQYTFNSRIVDPNKKKKKSRKSTFLTLGFLLLNIAIVAYIAYTSFAGQGNIFATSSEVFALWKKNVKYILLAFCMPLISILMESCKYCILVRHKTGVWNFRLGLRTTIMGKYYDNITPLSSGGQPFQIFYLKKDGVPLGVATGLPFISFFLNQLALVIASVIIMIYLSIHQLGSANAVVETFKIVAWIGTITSIIVPATIIGVSIWPKFTRKIADGVVVIINKIKFIRHKEKYANTIYNTLDEYQRSMSQYKKSGFVLSICFILSVIYKVALYSTPYFIVRACGVTPNYLEIFALTLILTVSVSFIPTPGSSGASELSFQAMFLKTLASVGLGAVYTFWCMIYWRFCVYFLFIILGMIEMVILSLKHKRRKAYIPEPVMATLYQVPIYGIKVLHKDQTSCFIPFVEGDAQCYISDGVASFEFRPRKTLTLRSDQDFSCLTDNSYVFISKDCIRKMIAKLDATKLYGISFIVDKTKKLGPTIEVDTGKEKSPLAHPDTKIETVQFIDYYRPLRGEAIKHAENYAISLNEDGFDTRVFAPKLKKKFPVYKTNQYPLIYTPSLRFFFTNYSMATPNKKISLKMSLEPNNSLLIFHAQTPFMMGKYALKMARRYDVPIVVSFRHAFYHKLKRPLHSRFIAKLVELNGMSLYKRCDAVFIPSLETGEILKRKGYKGPTMVVEDSYEAYDEPTILEKRMTERKYFHIEDDEKVMLTLATKKEEKDKFLRGLKLLDALLQEPITIMVYGFKHMERQKIRKEYTLKNIRLILLTHSVFIEEAIQASDLLLLQRERDGAFPYERIAAGYRVPSMIHGMKKEEYKVGENCFLLPRMIEESMQAIMDAMKNDELRKQVGDKAWETLTISKEQNVKNIENAYREVIRRYYESVKK